MKKLLHNIYNVYRDPECDGFGYLVPRMGESTTIREEYEEIASVGGIKIVFITDYHLGGASSEEIASRFAAEVLSSVIEQAKLKKKGLNKLNTFPYERQNLAADLEIIPVPGHTSGGVCLLWEDGKHRYLFTGDFLYFDGKTWIPGAKTRGKIEASLNLLKAIEFDILIGCGSDNVDQPYLSLPNKRARVRFIDSVLVRLSRRALSDRIPGASGYVLAKSFLDQSHERGASRTGHIRAEDLTSVDA